MMMTLNKKTVPEEDVWLIQDKNKKEFLAYEKIHKYRGPSARLERELIQANHYSISPQLLKTQNLASL